MGGALGAGVGQELLCGEACRHTALSRVHSLLGAEPTVTHKHTQSQFIHAHIQQFMKTITTNKTKPVNTHTAKNTNHAEKLELTCL